MARIQGLKKTKCDFEYNGRRFIEYPVTDIKIINEISKNETIELNEAIFVMSLGENFNGFYYKIIAQIFY